RRCETAQSRRRRRWSWFLAWGLGFVRVAGDTEIGFVAGEQVEVQLRRVREAASWIKNENGIPTALGVAISAQRLTAGSDGGDGYDLASLGIGRGLPCGQSESGLPVFGLFGIHPDFGDAGLAENTAQDEMTSNPLSLAKHEAGERAARTGEHVVEHSGGSLGS